MALPFNPVDAPVAHIRGICHTGQRLQLAHFVSLLLTSSISAFHQIRPGFRPVAHQPPHLLNTAAGGRSVSPAGRSIRDPRSTEHARFCRLLAEVRRSGNPFSRTASRIGGTNCSLTIGRGSQLSIALVIHRLRDRRLRRSQRPPSRELNGPAESRYMRTPSSARARRNVASEYPHLAASATTVVHGMSLFTEHDPQPLLHHPTPLHPVPSPDSAARPTRGPPLGRHAPGDDSAAWPRLQWPRLQWPRLQCDSREWHSPERSGMAAIRAASKESSAPGPGGAASRLPDRRQRETRLSAVSARRSDSFGRRAAPLVGRSVTTIATLCSARRSHRAAGASRSRRAPVGRRRPRASRSRPAGSGATRIRHSSITRSCGNANCRSVHDRSRSEMLGSWELTVPARVMRNRLPPVR